MQRWRLSPCSLLFWRSQCFFHWPARLFVDESPAGLYSNSVGNVFINFTSLKTCVKKSHSATWGRLKRYGDVFWSFPSSSVTWHMHSLYCVHVPATLRHQSSTKKIAKNIWYRVQPGRGAPATAGVKGGCGVHKVSTQGAQHTIRRTNTCTEFLSQSLFHNSLHISPYHRLCF
jgi:hypothetical protein